MDDTNIINLSFTPMKPTVMYTLDAGKSPAEWVELLAKKGITISERNLRERANRIGARIKLGRNMLITLGHIELILKENQCPSNHTSARASGGRKAGLNTTASPSPRSSDPVREHYLKLERGNGATTRKSANDDSISSAPKKRKKTGR